MQTLSPDAQAIVLLCSALATSRSGSAKPFGPKEWHGVATQLRDHGASPKDLLSADWPKLERTFGFAPPVAERITELAGRGGQLAVDIEDLASVGIWVVTRADDSYPRMLKERLKGAAPPVLFGAGDASLLDGDSLAVVGSRDVGADGETAAAALGRACARERVALVSGGARGVDAIAMGAALEDGGHAVGVLADSLRKAATRGDSRRSLSEGQLLLLSPFHPGARFSVGQAMARNKLVYALSQAAVVVATAAESGGTWAGAIEDLRNAWVPLWVLDDGSPGTAELIRRGGIAFPLSEASDVPARARLHTELTGSPDGLAAVHEPSTASQPELEPGAAVPSPTDAFAMVWPALSDYLTEPRAEKDVAVRFDVLPTQARAWLKRAVEERLVEKLTRPVRYLRAGEAPSQLFADVPLPRSQEAPDA